ncbi:MAG: STAS domain-containing protein [Pseudotabrizicola sp.]|uniref:STAS domain-containing protein n=1 Tax=Pseudotabrizicola sp. TaxID=2939647 RepID=UPI002717F36D|nr:STAS domain-containing protein [Pseudotabrizicola sp.]MDO8882228.1 STAS domain-containing protein [Pseudotabrizicola sp.]MDP2079460.1 STAS domain-containing protein [Pseudotabrizicola sp.]MDZ7573650.1 STAS domain-containing protein [Pseudotabrizicola sp.]
MRTLELVARVTPDSAQALWYDLESRFDAAGARPEIAIDGSAVRHLSAAAVQVLLMAQRRAKRDGGVVSLIAASPECCECLRIMGALALIGEDGE